MIRKHLWTDGGVILVNPSTIGGTWAFRLVAATYITDVAGGVLHSDGVEMERSGLVLPADLGMIAVSNNITELLAVIEGLEAMPPGWSGTIYTDSQVTIRRVMQTTAKPPEGLTAAILERLDAARARVGPFNMSLVGGHPTKKEVLAGVRKDGKPVSIHNVWADKECGRVAAEYLARRTEGGK